MRLAIVCFNLRWQAGGVRLIYAEAQALQKLGHTVHIYAPDYDPQVHETLRKGLDIRRIDAPYELRWKYSSQRVVVRVWEKFVHERNVVRLAQHTAHGMDADYDVVNVHDFAYPVARFYRVKNPRARIVWTMNDPPYQYLPKPDIAYDILSRFYNACADMAARRYFPAIDGVAVLANRNARWARARGMRAEVVWSGIDFEGFHALPKRIAEKKRFLVLGVGALNRHRRFEDIVDAIAILRTNGRDVRALLVAKNIWGEDAYAEELREYARAREVADCVDFRFDGAGEAELRKLYASADFFALPIHMPPPRDGFGWQIVPFEAMAAGVPVIVSRKNDVTEALRDGETALFVDPLRPDEIAKKVEYLITHPAEYDRIAAAGQALARSMTWEAYAREVVELAAGEAQGAYRRSNSC